MQFVGLGIEMVAPIVLFMYVGYRLDLHFKTTPWIFLVGAFAGIGVGFYSMFKRVGILGPKKGPKDGS
jgi:F0F1-type ATP synthase assembly protein I